MKTIVLYRSKYGSTREYATHIGKALDCEVCDAKGFNADDLALYDNIIYGGGLYSQTIFGVSLITKNYEKLKDKKIAVFTTGITPLDCREYYEKDVNEKNFTPQMLAHIKVYNYLGKMINEELSLSHRLALKTLKKIMAGKKNPTPMQKLLLELCDFSDDLTDINAIWELVEYIKTQK